MTIHASLWMVDAEAVTDADLQRYRGWLTPSEMARHQRFVRAFRQRQFVVGRILLRATLARALGVAPQEVKLEEQIGKAPRLAAPVLKGGAPGLPGFSIAHSGRWVACAVSGQTALGLDIEIRDASRDLSALAAQAFDADEMSQWDRIKHLPDAERVDGFYKLWSEKEARFKLNQVGGHCVSIAHPELSIMLCTEHRLAAPPRIEMVTLP